MSRPLISIRSATLEDARGIAHVQIEGWRSAYAGIIDPEYLNNLNIDERTEIWQKNLLYPGSTTWVAIAQDEVVGFCGVGPLRPSESVMNLNPNTTGEVYAIYILPNYQRQGIGCQLFSYSQDYFKNRGWSQYILWALKENKSGQLFYQSQGGIPVAEEIRPIAGKDYLEVCYLFK